jgi:hypothetical protein
MRDSCLCYHFMLKSQNRVFRCDRKGRQSEDGALLVGQGARKFASSPA